MADKIAAHLTLNEVEKMDAAQRRDIANWLRRQARIVEVKGDQLAKRYRARFFWWR